MIVIQIDSIILSSFFYSLHLGNFEWSKSVCVYADLLYWIIFCGKEERNYFNLSFIWNSNWIRIQPQFKLKRSWFQTLTVFNFSVWEEQNYCPTYIVFSSNGEWNFCFLLNAALINHLKEIKSKIDFIDWNERKFTIYASLFSFFQV